MAKGLDLAGTLQDIEKRFGVKVGSAADVVEKVAGMTTGNLAIDYATGVDGMPEGRIVECYGPPSSGKTTTALQCAAALQHKIISGGLDRYILYLDFEQAIDPDYCAALGLDVQHESFLLAQPTYMEQGGEASLELLASGKIALLVVDSVAAMAPRVLLDGDFDQRTAAMNRARLLNGWLLRLIGLLREHSTCAIFINHLMEAVDLSGMPQRGGPKESTPGGKGLKFYASMRLKFQQVGKVNADFDDPLVNGLSKGQVATQTKVTVTKNKVGPPFRFADVRVRYGAGFDNTWSAVQVLVAHKKIVKSGAWLTVYLDRAPGLVHPQMQVQGNKVQFQGENALLRFAQQHPDYAGTLVLAAVDVLASSDMDGTEPPLPDEELTEG